MTLAVDGNKESIPDLDDVMKVTLDGERIGKISKSLDPWDVADTGVMYCTPGLFEGLRAAQADELYGLADGLAHLASSGLATVCDVTGHWWLDVDTPTALRQAEAHVRQRLRKSA